MATLKPLPRAATPPPAPVDTTPALWRLGFRPFYLGAAIFAALSVPLWAAQFAGWLPRPYLAGPLWHAHEMLFGYALGVIAGFLLTAVRNWTQRPTPAGGWLAAMFALWVLARLLVLSPWPAAAAAANAAFPLAVAAGIAVPLVKSANRRNYLFVGLLVVLSLAVLAVDLSALGTLALPPWLGIGVGLDAVLVVMTVVGGRVIPMFTNNGVPGAAARRSAAVEGATLGTALALLAADAVQSPGLLVAVIAAAAAAAQAVRLFLWQPWKTLRVPLVWVLHAGYAWIPLHLVLRVLAEAGWVARPLAVHALTVGAIGGLTIGMMTRTSRGHTGRALVAEGPEVVCYVLVLAAALVRVFGPMLLPGHYTATVLAAAFLWCGGFALYAVRYAPWLSRPRIDGKPG